MASSDGSITVTQQEFAQLQSQLLSLRTHNYQLTESETLLTATVKRLRDELAAALASAEAASSAADASSLYSSSLALLGLSSPPTKDEPPQAQPTVSTTAAAATAAAAAPAPAVAASQQQPASTGSLWGLWGSSVDEEKENLKKTIAQQAEEHRLQISVLTQSIRELYVRNSALQCQLDDLASPSKAADVQSALNDGSAPALSSSASTAPPSAAAAADSADSADVGRDEDSAGDEAQAKSAAISIPAVDGGDESHSELSEIDLGQDDSNDTAAGSPERKPALGAPSLLGSSPSTPGASLRATLRTLNSSSGVVGGSSGSGSSNTLEQLIEDYQLELKAKSDQIAQHCKDKQLLKNELKIATQKIAHLTDQRNNDLEQLSSQQSRLGQLDLRINELQEALAASERRVKFLEGDAQQTQELLELTKTTKDQLAQQVLALTTQLESLQARFEAGEDLLAASNATVAELNERLSAQAGGEGAEQVIAQLEAELHSARSANEQLQQQLADGATASADSSSAVGELEERLAKLVASHKFEVASLLEQLNVANTKLADAQLDSGETARELQQRLGDALVQLAAAEQENVELAQEGIGLKEELCRSQDDYEQECAALRSSIDSVSAARDLYQKEADELRTRLDDLQREQAIEERKNQRLVRELQQQLQKLSSSPTSPSSSPSSLPDTQLLQEETNNLLMRIGQMQEEKIQLQDEVRQLKQSNEKISVQLKKHKALLAGNSGSSPMRTAARPASSPPSPPILEEDESSRLLIKIGEIQEQNNKLQEDNRRLRRMLAGAPPTKSSAVDVPTRGRGSPAARQPPGASRPGQDKRSAGESPGLSFGLGKLFDMSS